VLSYRYLFDDWNKFDFVVAVVSIIGLFVKTGVGVNVVRVFRIARVFRLIKRAKVCVRTLFRVDRLYVWWVWLCVLCVCGHVSHSHYELRLG
jgi:hypothetical protein